MSHELENFKKTDSQLLTLLTNHLPDMLWVKDLHGIYIYANKSICDNLLMAKDTDEPIGKGDLFFALREREAHKDTPDWHTFGEVCFNSDQVVIDSNKAMKFEEYGNIKGEMVYLEVYKAPFYDKNGNIIGTVGAGRDITQMKVVQQKLQKSLSVLDEQIKKNQFAQNHDYLTGLPNRLLLLDRLEQSIKRSFALAKKIALIYMDIDHFKAVNDSLGHFAGDQILFEVSKKISSVVKPSDTLAKIGGDEFCLILNDLESLSDITDTITEIQLALRESFVIEDKNIYIRLSMGVSLYPNDGSTSSILLKNADAAMFKSKSDGRNNYSFYDETMTKKAYERLTLESALREAILNEEFVVYYQPQVDISTNKVTGMEALVRWNHPTMGMISPDKFIPLAEENGMIVKLDRLVMKQAFKQFSTWKKDGLNPQKLSLNLAMKQIEESDFYDFLKDIAIEQKCSFECVEFEITETQIMKNPQQSIDALKKISELGIKISIDDFGTGYSSLSYLKRLPINKLKIDKSFVDELPFGAEDVAICKTIIDLCKNLNLEVIAEGVETLEQSDFLLQNGCSSVQGYFYHKPLPAHEVTKLLQSDVS